MSDEFRIQVWINDEVVTDLVDEEAHQQFPTGRIGLQVHGIKDYDGKPPHVWWRGIRVSSGIAPA